MIFRCICLFLALLFASGFFTGIPSPSSRSSSLRMGLFDIFKAKKSATAYHILVKGADAGNVLTKLKSQIESSSNKVDTFSELASKFSVCPSGKKGGYLGKFTQGQMVPAFDKVVFSEEIGVTHGPVKTPFGEHLILIESRED